MKNEKLDWMDWLHKMRAEEEERRRREGISMAEWLRRVNAEADLVMTSLHEQGQVTVVHDRPRKPGPARKPRSRKL
jgi:3-hydroxyisobutyrate dehydrogenase-like beta-hydroxyacid dehydrogenase